MRTTKHFRRGFTLIELIIVIAIIAIIAAAVFVALDPARRLHAGRNATRWSDVTAVLQSVKQYQADNQGGLPATAVAIDSDNATVQIIGESVGACGAVPACAGVNVAASNCGLDALDTDLAGYLPRVPRDPQGTTNDTRYFVNYNSATGVVTVGACSEEGEAAGGGGTPPTIEVTG